MAVSSPLGRWRASARREPLHPSLSASDSRQHDSGGSAGDGEERRHRPSRRERGKDQSRRVGLSAGLRPHDGAAGNYGVPLQVRDVSGLGARHGLLPAVRMDHSENNARPRVRSLSSLGCESSKRIQTGEPNSFQTKIQGRLVNASARRSFVPSLRAIHKKARCFRVTLFSASACGENGWYLTETCPAKAGRAICTK
jgi:hypothetical protein